MKKIFPVLLVAALAISGIAATITPAPAFSNLKVLPQNISEKQLDSVMDAYNRALKVSCDFCHSKKIDITGLIPEKDRELDFAADNSMKEEARRMMRLTIDLNRTHFSKDSIMAKKPDYQLNVVSCNTCHRGNPYPVQE